MASTEPFDVNLLHVQWKNPEYLAFLSAQKGGVNAGQSVLDASNVMEYFSTSPFYDRRSNNEHVRMQSAVLVNQALMSAHQLGTDAMQNVANMLETELKRFTGLEFALVHARPPVCFVIHKRWRHSPDKVDKPLASYYIINDCIYQAPDIYTILSTRLQSSIKGLHSTLREQREHRSTFSPRRGHYGRFLTMDPT